MLRVNISLVDTTQAFANGILPKIEVGRIWQVLAKNGSSGSQQICQCSAAKT